MTTQYNNDIRTNDIFFLCSLIEYVARQTHNRPGDIVAAIGNQGLQHIYDMADVYHCENIDKLTYEFCERYHIMSGDFDPVKEAQYNVPTHWDLGKVYQRIICSLAHDNSQVIPVLIGVFSSWLSAKIEDYNCSMYYENNSYLTACYQAGHAL